jgi:tetraacyldisaccharide 4'-kinase
VEEARRDALIPVTTEKDLVRIAALGPPAEAVAALPVALAFADEAALRGMLAARTSPGGEAASGRRPGG